MKGRSTLAVSLVSYKTQVVREHKGRVRRFFWTMYPSWGNYGGPQPPNYGAPGAANNNNNAGTGGFGNFENSGGGSIFSSLQEQHLQQMQQLQMLHQKQLQSVLHHGTSASAYSSGLTGGYSGPSWQPEDTSWQPEDTGLKDIGTGTQSYYPQKDNPAMPMRGPLALQQEPQQPPPPPPPQPHPKESQPAPPPPEPPSAKPAKLPESNTAPTPTHPAHENEKSSLQVKFVVSPTCNYTCKGVSNK